MLLPPSFSSSPWPRIVVHRSTELLTSTMCGGDGVRCSSHSGGSPSTCLTAYSAAVRACIVSSAAAAAPAVSYREPAPAEALREPCEGSARCSPRAGASYSGGRHHRCPSQLPAAASSDGVLQTQRHSSGAPSAHTAFVAAVHACAMREWHQRIGGGSSSVVLRACSSGSLRFVG